MWPIESLYVVCTYDELNYYMKEWWGWWCGSIDYQVELLLYMCICEVLTHRTLTLRDSGILDMICGIVTSNAVNLSDQKNDDTMTQSNNPDRSKVWFYRV